MSTMTENWKAVVGFKGLYEVSNCGRVRNARTAYVLRSRPDSDGYRILTLWKGAPTKAYTVKLHRLVAQAFIRNPKQKPHINHRDFDRANNMPSNLLWATPAENIEHSRAAGRMIGGGQRPVVAYLGNVSVFAFPSISAVASCGFNRKAVQLVLGGQQKRHRGLNWRYV